MIFLLCLILFRKKIRILHRSHESFISIALFECLQNVTVNWSALVAWSTKQLQANECNTTQIDLGAEKTTWYEKTFRLYFLFTRILCTANFSVWRSFLKFVALIFSSINTFPSLPIEKPRSPEVGKPGQIQNEAKNTQIAYRWRVSD